MTDGNNKPIRNRTAEFLISTGQAGEQNKEKPPQVSRKTRITCPLIPRRISDGVGRQSALTP